MIIKLGGILQAINILGARTPVRTEYVCKNPALFCDSGIQRTTRLLLCATELEGVVYPRIAVGVVAVVCVLFTPSFFAVRRFFGSNPAYIST